MSTRRSGRLGAASGSRTHPGSDVDDEDLNSEEGKDFEDSENEYRPSLDGEEGSDDEQDIVTVEDEADGDVSLLEEAGPSTRGRGRGNCGRGRGGKTGRKRAAAVDTVHLTKCETRKSGADKLFLEILELLTRKSPKLVVVPVQKIGVGWKFGCKIILAALKIKKGNCATLSQG